MDIKLIPNLKNRKRLNKSQILVYFQWLEIVTVLFCYFSGYWEVYVILGGKLFVKLSDFQFVLVSQILLKNIVLLGKSGI